MLLPIPYQTELFEGMLDTLESLDNSVLSGYFDTVTRMGYANVSNIVPDVSGAINNRASNMNIDNVTITLNEAQLKEDADYEQVAERVGDIFVKELSKQGMNVLSYSF